MNYNEYQAILEFIKGQRFFRFKNMRYIVFDKETGLLWSNHPSFSQNKLSFGESRYQIRNTDLGFPGFEVPQIKDIVELYHGGNPFRWLRETVVNAGTVCMEIGDIINDICRRYQSGTCYPCSHYLEENFDKTSAETILALFMENNLIPAFYIDSTDKAYEKLLNTQTSSKSLCLKFSGSLHFDSSEILSQYDITAINSSLYKYCENVKKLCSNLIDNVVSFEENNSEVLSELKKMTSYLSKDYINDVRLSDEENSILDRIHCRICNSGYTDFENIKGLLRLLISEVDKLKNRLDKATMSISFFEELGKIQAEPKPSFSLIVDVIVKQINSVYDNIVSYSSRHEYIEYLAETYEKKREEHIKQSTEKRYEYMDKCRKEYIDDDITLKWIEESKEISISRLKAFSSIADYCLKHNTTPDDNDLYKKICDLLSLHTEAVNYFYDNQRIGIYQNNAFSLYSEVLDKIETEKKLYEATSEFRKRTLDLITNASEADSRIIINCTNELCDMPLVQLLDLKNSELGNRLSQETLAMLDKLRYNNYDTMKNDAKTFAEAQERRDKEFNSLIFKMRKELERR